MNQDIDALLEKYIDHISDKYESRVNYNVKEFVRGFALYLNTQLPAQEIRSAENGGVAVITEYHNHLTGGRYYTWMVALALVEAGIQTTVYTNKPPTFVREFSQFKQPRIEIIGKTGADLSSARIRADAYIGSPINGSLSALRNGQRFKKPSYPMIFDPLPMIEKYQNKNRFVGWNALVAEIKESDTKIMTLCKSVHPYIHDWLNKSEDKLFPVYPCINSQAKALAKKAPREDFVLFMSRLVPNKRLNHVLAACKDNRINLKIITSASGIDHTKLIRESGMMQRTEVLFNVSDVEKFELIYKSRAVINGSIFEGFGMWLAEAIACGTPAVCYQYPTFSEIRNHSLATNVYMATWNEPKALSQQLARALDEQKYTQGTTIFDFQSMVDRVKELC